MGLRITIICLLLGLAALPAVEGGIGDTRGDRDDTMVLKPEYRRPEAAVPLAEASGSAIIHVFNTGLVSRDGFWTSNAVEASATVPVVAVTGGLESEQAKAWNLRELPAVVAADRHGNLWARLEGKAVKPAAVQQLMLQSKGLVTRMRAQVAEAIVHAIDQTSVERRIPGSIELLSRYAALRGLPEADAAQAGLDQIVARGFDELRVLEALMARDPPAARRALPKFERLYAGTPLIEQAKRVREGLPIERSTPAAPPSAEPQPAEETGGTVDIFGDR